MRYPDFLEDKQTIGLIAPSFGCASEPYKSCMDAAIKRFRDMGYTVVEGPNCRKEEGIGISSSPENCGSELTDFYLDDRSNVLFTCGGGELMCETIDYVDFDRLKDAKSKWYMGYSDNTNFTFLSNILLDTAAIYGPSIGSFGMSRLHQCHQDVMDIVTGKKLTVSGYDTYEIESLKSSDNPYASYNLTEKKILKIFEGTVEVNSNVEFEGRLTGGCLDCLSTLVGTKYDKVDLFNEKYQSEGVIWFLEACDLNLMSIRRSLWNLDRAGWFKNAAGFIIGRPLAAYKTQMMGLDEYNAVYGILGKYNVPIIFDADIGHISPTIPLISGAYAQVLADNSNFTVKHILK